MADTSGTYTLTGLLFSNVTAGAAINQNPTGPVTYNITGLLSTFNISSAANSTVVVNQNVSVGDTINLVTNGGTISAGTGLLLDTVNVTIAGGGDYIAGTGTGTLSLLNGNGAVGFSGTGGTLTVGTANTYAATSETTLITGFKTGVDQIDDRSLKFSGITGYTVTGTPGGTQTITISDSSGNFSFETSNAGLANGTYTSLTTGPIKLTADASGGTTISAVCFLAGTRLATPAGETPVEALAEGDLVAVRENGETVYRPVLWIGRRKMDVARAGGAIEAYPVRIRAGAFAEGVPHRDLLVTSEHCVFADGRLIPARMLVNGSSIIVDVGIAQYEYFHVELERHAILIAEGLETESYLDTGNRGNFANSAVPALRADFGIDAAEDAWNSRAAAPLAVDRAIVEPVWRRLAERAEALGRPAAASGTLTAEPDLRIVTDSGLEIRPSLQDGTSYAFVVPGGTRSLRLASRAARPSETVGPFVDDRRMLGVKVGKIGLGVGRRRVTVDAAAEGALPGWHAAEPDSAHRWTDGDAVLPIDLSGWGGAPVLLDIEVAAVGPFPAVKAAALAA